MHEEKVCDLLKASGIDLALTLPCDRAGDLCFLLPGRVRTGD
jgi:sulfopyruvate decarboxylase subunit beta